MKNLEINFDFIDFPEFDTEKYRRIIKDVLEHHKINQDCFVNIYFVSENEIKELNNNFRNKDQITDVISLEYQDDLRNGHKTLPTELPLILGEIFICIKQAKRQADLIGQTLDDEINFLILHGMLHLLGYDHKNSEQELEMINKQKQIQGEV